MIFFNFQNRWGILALQQDLCKVYKLGSLVDWLVKLWHHKVNGLSWRMRLWRATVYYSLKLCTTYPGHSFLLPPQCTPLYLWIPELYVKRVYGKQSSWLNRCWQWELSGTAKRCSKQGALLIGGWWQAWDRQGGGGTRGQMVRCNGLFWNSLVRCGLRRAKRWSWICEKVS